ncbi:hypothetical protein [Mucilaginibacter sp. PPCGB 2223]|uniref:hypothetical protein n=1 Tax=Mucilaginibacter sp. PPCGB 2223 TaxID=1886027 RepID=UPI0011119B61|nr:hypothetical protein [Mucilaginibacter sp. PPCGB 2223]
MTNLNPLKKAWAEPVIIIISSASIEAVKAHPSVHENTGHVNASFPSYFNSALNGNGFKGTRSSAAS